MNRLLSSVVLTGLVALGVGNAQAQNLLTNGSIQLNPASTQIPPWTLEETVTGMPGAAVNSAQQQNFANMAGEVAGQFGLWFQPFAGNLAPYLNQNKMVNAILSQTVTGAANEEYTFTGWSRFEQNYAGGFDTLDPASPSGAIASPTETIFSLEFLDSGGGVLGSPTLLDVKEDREAQIGFPFANDNLWYQHTVMGTAPLGTANVRVTAAGLNGVANVNPSQSAMLDNFSLTGASAPATELLGNGNLDTAPPPPPVLPGWTVTELPAPKDTLGEATFANRPGSAGGNGVWLKGFAVGDGTVAQTVAGTPGGEYEFSLWSAWEINYSGGQPGTTTQDFMTLEFLDASEMPIGSAVTTTLQAEGQTPAAGPVGMHPEAWRQFSIDGTAPANTAFVRVSAGALGMFNVSGAQSAFLDDFELTLAGAGLEGDYNGDGTVDAADYVVWRRTDGSPAGYDTWRENFGATAPGAGGGSGNLLARGGAVPEPTGLMLALVVIVSGAAVRRRS